MSIQPGAAPGKIGAVIVTMVILIACHTYIATMINSSSASKKTKKARKELTWRVLLIFGILGIAVIMAKP